MPQLTLKSSLANLAKNGRCGGNAGPRSRRCIRWRSCTDPTEGRAEPRWQGADYVRAIAATCRHSDPADRAVGGVHDGHPIKRQASAQAWPAAPHLAVVLTKAWCGIQFSGDETAEQPVMLDTVHLDVRAHDPTAHRITMICRAQVDRPARFAQCEIVSGRLESYYGTFRRPPFW